METRPRVTSAELEYLCDLLRERELMLRELYEALTRKAIYNVARYPKGGVDLSLEKDLLSLWKAYGKRGLWHACSLLKHFGRGRYLADELRKPSITSVSDEVWIAKGLRARFESLLKGKKKGRISAESEMARIFLAQRKR